MKKLILIICLIGVVWGQEYKTSNSRPTKFYKFDKKTQLWSCDTPIFIGDFIEYEKECYADSTYYSGAIDCPDGIVGCGVLHWGNYWTHKEPTFKGFVEYIKRRLK